MADNYPGISQWGLSVPIVTDDSLRDASEYSAGQVALTDRTEYLKGQGFYSTPSFGGTYTNVGTYRIQGGIYLADVSTSVTFAARTYTRGPIGLYSAVIDGVKWSEPINGAFVQGSDVTTPSPILWRMDVPSQATVTGISVWVDPPPAHVGLPATKPALTAFILDPVAGTAGLIPGSTVTDPTILPDYEDPHQFSTGVLNTFVPEGSFVVIAVSGEYGANAKVGLKAFPPAITFTREKLGE